MHGVAQTKDLTTVGTTPTATTTTPEKPKRTPEEEEALRNQFLLAINGYHVGEVEDDKLTKINEYVIQGDGIYLIVKNKIGKFVQRIHSHNFPGLPKQFEAENKVFLKVPLIPASIYYQIKAWFTDICTEMGDNEAFCQVYLNTHTGKYQVHVPKQKVSKASVNYDAEDTPATESDPDGKYLLVYECHSHNSMGAFWSGTDNADEKNTRFYGVFGQLDKEDYAEKHRYIILGKEVDIKREHIFDFSEEKKISKEEILNLLSNKSEDLVDKAEVLKLLNKKDEADYPESWTEQIELPTVYTGYSNYGGYRGGYGRGGGNALYSGQGGYGQQSGYSQHSAPVNQHGAAKKNTDIAGRRTSSYKSNFPGDTDWDPEGYWGDDYAGYDYEGETPSYLNDPRYFEEEDEEAGEISQAAWLESVHDAYDLTDLEGDEDAMETALSSFCNSLPTMYVPDLMDKLIDHGHEATCKAFWKA